jgi:Flp pilus assembly protein TadG
MSNRQSDREKGQVLVWTVLLLPLLLALVGLVLDGGLLFV